MLQATEMSARCTSSSVVGQKAALLPRLAPLASRLRHSLQCQAVKEAESRSSSSSPTSSSSRGEEVYIGFAKGDYDRSAGRKGRVIVDNPNKYPNKEDLGLFAGATGGWAGGEAALWKLREEISSTKKSTKGAAPKAAPKPAAKPGAEVIYVGYGKDSSELEKRKSGIPGRFIVDDPTKYPDKEDVGFLAGATGGFAGGEAGVKQFVRDGEVILRKPGQAGGGQFSPLTLAGLLVLAGAGGGILLTDVFDVGEEVVREEITQAPIDSNTKTLLLVAVALLGAAGLLAAGRATVTSLSQQLSEGLQESASKLVLYAGFWLVVFLAARAVLEL